MLVTGAQSSWTAGSVYLGYNAGSSGELVVEQGATATINYLDFGPAGASGNNPIGYGTIVVQGIGSHLDLGSYYTLVNQGSSITIADGGAVTLGNGAGGIYFSNNTTLMIGAGGAAGTLSASYVAINGTIVFNHTGDTTFATQIRGSGSLTKSGGGTTVLSGSNEYTGTTTVAEGTLVAGKIAVSSGNSSLGNATGEIVLGGPNASGTLRYTGNSATYTRGFTIAAGGGAFEVANAGQTVTIQTGNVSANGNFTIGGDGNTTINSVISGAGGLAKVGNGTLTLNNVNTYTGITTLAGGALSIAASGALGNESAAVSFDGGTLLTTASFTASRATTLGDSGGSFNTADGTTLTWNGDISGTGALAKLGAGTLVLGGANSYSGATQVNAGTLRLGSAGALSPNTTLNVAAGASFDANGFQQTFTGLTGGGTVDTGSAGMTIQTSSESSTPNVFEGALAGSGPLTVEGTGTLVIASNNNSYTGETLVTGGTLVVTGDISSSTQTTVTGNGVLAGTGTVGSVTIGGGGWLSPGSSPGTLAVNGNATMDVGGNYAWEINDAEGVTGANWDFVSVSGTLTITATVENPFTISIASLTPLDESGELFNFSADQNYSYTIASAGGGIFGFNASVFTINTAGFLNDLAGGVWSIAQSGNDLNLVFTASAIPEPATYAILFGTLALFLAVRHRRRQKTKV